MGSLVSYYSWDEGAFPANTMRMTFVTNHDKNAWEGTQFEMFGDALPAATVLSVVGDGIPLIYNGQEAGNPRRLAFFEKDSIEWREHPTGDLYQRLFALKHENTALWNASWGAAMVKVPNDAESEVLSFVRENERDRVLAVFNLSAESRTVRLDEDLYYGSYADYFSGASVTFDSPARLEIEPWGYRTYVRAEPMQGGGS